MLGEGHRFTLRCARRDFKRAISQNTTDLKSPFYVDESQEVQGISLSIYRP